VLGFVENMSYVKCPSCELEHQVFGPGKTREAAAQLGVQLLDRVPLDPKITEAIDAGQIESYDNDYLNGTIAAIEAILQDKPELPMRLGHD
jgi:hypothetical protein